VRQRPTAEAFYRALLTGLTLDGHCEIHSLHAEGRCIASKLCTYTRSECSTLKSGYDESYARISPGRLITNKTYEQACEDPLIKRISTVSDAPWLRLWLPTANGMRRAFVSLRPVSGTVALVALRLRYGPVRAIVRRMKARKRARDDRTHARRGRDAE
jgi:CelD/BcsL family acetyltransferase involved in cellulose biosynthesis